MLCWRAEPPVFRAHTRQPRDPTHATPSGERYPALDPHLHMPKRSRASTAEPSDSVIATFNAWLLKHGTSLDGVAIRATSEDASSYGLVATKALRPGMTFGNLPLSLIIDPLHVLAHDRVARAALAHGGSPAYSFWLSLAAASKDPDHFHAPYFAALPRVAPDPLSWTAAQRALLCGTQLAVQVANQRHLLELEHARVAPTVAPHASFDDVLWARGCHLSRCFPRALCDAAGLATNHEVLGSDQIDDSARLTVEQGGPGAARIAWSTARMAPAAEPTAAEEELVGAASDAVPHSAANAASGCDASPAVRSHAAIKATSHQMPNGRSETASASLQPQPSGCNATSHGEEFAASNLGCMLPLYDMADHRVGHPIGWQAGCGGVRFCCRVPVRAGAALFNSDGSGARTHRCRTTPSAPAASATEPG